MRRLGIKIWSINGDSFPRLKEMCDAGIINYIEMYTVPGSYDEALLSQLKGLPIIFHAPNFSHGFNIRDENDVYIESISTIKKFFKFFGNKPIIFHPGWEVGGDDLSIVTGRLKTLLADGFDIILENVPKLPIRGEVSLLASAFEDFKKMARETGVKVCVDVGHTIASANYHGEEPIRYLEKFFSLDPYMIHLCDGKIDGNKDEHMDIGTGSFPLQKIADMVPPDAFVTLETPKSDFKELSEDIRNLSKIRSLFGGKAV